MGAIKLKHTSGNGTILNSPAANPSSDITLKLPSTTGSAGQVLKVASANHSSTNAELEFAAGGKFASYAIICDEKSAGTNGGTMTSGTWHTRDLNTEIADADGIVSISSNQFTLQAGTYLIKANAAGYYVQDHMIKLYNVTASADIAFGTSAYSNVQAQTRSFLVTRITIGAARTFEIRHKSGATKSTNGFGESTNLAVEKYLIVEIYKES
jgi:5-hydroxyisourate hydrolase-like protein (transthyretin family)